MKKFRFSDLTETDRKAIYYIMFILTLGFVLNLTGYTPPILNESQEELSNQEKLEILLAQDFMPRYDLNTVSYDELLFFRGIGPATAQAILEYQQNTGFFRVDDLINIRGIGARRLEEFRSFFFVVGDTVQITNGELQVTSYKLQEIPPPTPPINVGGVTPPINVGGNPPSVRTEVSSTRSQSEIGTTSRLININTATAEELTALRGIGPSRAAAIIEYRTTHGGFRRIEDIQNVRGIGVQTFQNIKEFITVE